MSEVMYNIGKLLDSLAEWIGIKPRPTPVPVRVRPVKDGR